MKQERGGGYAVLSRLAGGAKQVGLGGGRGAKVSRDEEERANQMRRREKNKK